MDDETAPLPPTNDKPAGGKRTSESGNAELYDIDRYLHLLTDISGTFRPGVLTALMGVSGAGKTTLMDVLAGRKTVGMTVGNIWVGGYTVEQSALSRVLGYVEQSDIHSPRVGGQFT